MVKRGTWTHKFDSVEQEGLFENKVMNIKLYYTYQGSGEWHVSVFHTGAKNLSGYNYIKQFKQQWFSTKAQAISYCKDIIRQISKHKKVKHLPAKTGGIIFLD